MHAGARRSNRLDVADPLGSLQERVDHHGFFDAMLRFELRKQLIEKVNVPGPFDLGQHDDIEFAANSAHDLDDIVQHPGAVQRVDARPQSRAPELVRARQFDETLPRRFLFGGRDRILQVPQNHIDLLDELGDFGADFFHVRRHEVDHAFQPHRLLNERSRSTGRERLEKL